MEKDQRDSTEQEHDVGTERPNDDQQPRVYSLEKGLTGWKFSRRGFLGAAAAATAAAATAASSVTKASESSQGASESTHVQDEWISLEVTTDVITFVDPDQPFTQKWTLTNKSETAWTKGLSLHLEDGAALQLQQPIQVPDIAPGGTVDVEVELVSPAEPGTHHNSWHLRSASNVAPVAHGPLLFLATCIAESSHPYANNANWTAEVRNPDTNADYTQIHFSRVDVEEGYDFVNVRDSSGRLIQRITGQHPSGLWSMSVPGRTVRVQLVSDSVVPAWGYCVDQVRTVATAHVLHLPLVLKQPTPRPTPTPSPTPCYCYDVCTCDPQCSCDGYYCSCDYIHYWYPN